MMQKMKKWIVVLLVASLLCAPVAMVQVDAAEGETQNNDWVYDTENSNNTNTYYYYMEKHQNAIKPDHEAAVDIADFQVIEPEGSTEASGTKAYENMEGSEKGVYIDAKGEQVEFTVTIPESGLYCIELDYFPLAVSSSQYLFGLYIDGELPFTEANGCVLTRVYKNDPIREDESGDDLRPQSSQTPQWRKQFLYDQTGVYGNLKFYMEAGVHKIALRFDGTPLLLQGLTFKQEPYLMSYQDYISLYQQKGYKETEGVLELFQAENYYQQSSSTLWPDADKSSPLTQPFEYSNVKINYGGGSQWKQPGQWISWKIDVPEDGFYNLGCKYKQGYLDGLFSSRKVYIDGVVPFEELSAVRFNYTSQWKNLLLGGESGPYSIYLTKGEHIITMENVIGDLTDTMGVLQAVIANLNDIYLSIVMITSSSPDPYRDYYLDRLLPNLPEDFRKNADLLFQEAERLEETVGAKGAENAYFEDVAYNLQSYADNITDLTYKERLTNFKNDINGLSAKLSTYQEQALDLDFIALLSADQSLPKTNLNAWEWIVYQVRSFFSSFAKKDYEKDEEAKTIRVWINSGIDQFEIMKNMITDEFTPKTGIHVDLELAQGSLVNALAAGTGPDVMVGVTSDMVVNLALRGAAVDLSSFDTYWEILDEYVEGSEIPFMLEGRYYGMPNTHGCTVMFVRTDIFESMGLEVPQTWDDMYDVAQVLQRYNMSLGTAASFANLLYQKGGSYFNEDMTEVEFDEDVAVEALIQHTEFYTKYGFPQVFDMANRFRTGEMPIGIAAYSVYTTLKYTAPEISGLWDIYLTPGTLKEDGTIDRTQMDNTGSGAVMLSGAEDKDAAWAFIDWWSRAEAQTRYANDVEAALGISARYTTANIQTLRSQGWTNKELSVLEQQLDWLEFIPIVPGNYYVTRGLTNSIRGVIDDGANAREMLTEWTIKINDEILRKRNEFFKNN
ncbi:MAG: extracellular solute-binding protein [Ruminococcaceae bacterium]|nr:extracellular solute-binding protein [Oscillospiraceae bacterium]